MSVLRLWILACNNQQQMPQLNHEVDMICIYIYTIKVCGCPAEKNHCRRSASAMLVPSFSNIISNSASVIFPSPLWSIPWSTTLTWPMVGRTDSAHLQIWLNSSYSFDVRNCLESDPYFRSAMIRNMISGHLGTTISWTNWWPANWWPAKLAFTQLKNGDPTTIWIYYSG